MVNKMTLTPQQLNVLIYIAQGLTDDQMGEKLGISGRTVNVHADAMRKTLGATNRPHAVALALSYGIIKLEEIFSE